MNTNTTRLLLLLTLIAATKTYGLESDTLELTHQVSKGDNLYNLSKQYLGNANAWHQLAQLNNIRNPLKLVPNSVLKIPRIQTQLASLVYLQGEVNEYTQDGRIIRQLKQGDILSEGAEIRVGENSYASLQFEDGSISRMFSQSSLKLAQLPAVEPKLRKSTRLHLDRGTVDVSVIPRDSKKAPFEVTTPLAVAAVRGTQFGVSLTQSQQTSSYVTHGIVALSGSAPTKKHKVHSALIQAGQAAVVSTDGVVGKVLLRPAAPSLDNLPAVISDEDFIRLNIPALSNVKMYQAHIASDTALEKIMRNADFNTSAILFSALPDGEYTIGVRTINSDDIFSEQAQQRFNVKTTPAAPYYIQPRMDAQVSTSPKLQCTETPGASAYHLQIAIEEAFVAPELDINIKHCEFSATNLAAGQHYWRVSSIITQAGTVTDEGPFSKPAKFTVRDGATADKTEPVIYWATEPAVHFTAQISKDAEFKEILHESELEQPVFPLSQLAAGTYFIRLQTRHTSGLVGGTSKPRAFEIDATSMERTWMDKPK